MAGLRLTPVQARDILSEQLARLAPSLGTKPARVCRLSAMAHARSYAAGELILPTQDSTGFLALVVEGQVAVYTARWGDRVPVTILGPGDTFGQALLVGGRAAEATLRALSRCEIRLVTRTDLLAPAHESGAQPHPAAPSRWVSRHAGLLALGLVVLLVLGLAPVQRSLALIPMGVGQWCREQDLSACTESAWRLAAALAPHDANPLLALGILREQQGEPQAAEQYLQAALALAPDSPEIQNNLGFLYAGHGDHERAIAAFRRALALDPGAAAIHVNLAQSLQASQQHAEALIHYQAAAALGADQGHTLVNMAIAYYELGQLDKATETAAAALSYDHSLAAAHTVLGAVALKAQQPQTAVGDLQRAVALDAGDGRAYYYLGLAYQALDQTGEAMHAFERALATADDDVRDLARLSLARLQGKATAGQAP